MRPARVSLARVLPARVPLVRVRPTRVPLKRVCPARVPLARVCPARVRLAQDPPVPQPPMCQWKICPPCPKLHQERRERISVSGESRWYLRHLQKRNV